MHKLKKALNKTTTESVMYFSSVQVMVIKYECLVSTTLSRKLII